MPLQNRVTPPGELIADPARGLIYENRGCLHDETGRIRRRYNGKRWIACRLEFRGWQRGRLLQPGKFTELFFLDEATVFAAGYRPCAVCRREDYDRSPRSGANSTPTRRGRTPSTSSSTRSGSTRRRAGTVSTGVRSVVRGAYSTSTASATADASRRSAVTRGTSSVSASTA